MKLTNSVLMAVVLMSLLHAFAGPSDEPQDMTMQRHQTQASSKSTAARILSGKQVDSFVELNDGGTYNVNSEYIIPKGYELVVGEGVTLVFADNIGMSVSGGAKLTVSGSSGRPATFRGKRSGVGVWTGIRMENKAKVEICGAVITGAKIGLKSAWGSSAVVRRSLFAQNEEGVCFWENNGQMEDCVLTKNSKDGAQVHYGPSIFNHCTISENGKGIGGWGSARLISCRLVGNLENGIDCSNGKSTATECIIENNRGFDVVCPGGVWDFGKNYWGAAATRRLSQQGASANLSKIKDKLDGHGEGIVDLTGFLVMPPEDCGARDYPGCKNGSLRGEKEEAVANEEPASGGENAAEDGNEDGSVPDLDAGSGSVDVGGEPSFTKPTPVPDTAQATKAVKIVKELVEDDVKAMNAGKLDKQKFAMKLLEDSKLSDNVAVKFVLFRNSFNLLLNVGDVATAQKLFDAVYVKFGGRFASAMANFSRDTLKKMANTPKHAAAAKPLLALVEEAEESCKACDEAAKELGKRPSDQKARMRLAINAIKISDWGLALKTYAKNDDDKGRICSWELMDPKSRTADYTAEKVGDYWWGFVDGKDEHRLLFKSTTRHAAYWYRKALAEGEMSELKKKLVEKRLASISRTGKLKAKTADQTGGGKPKCYKCKGQGTVQVFRLEPCAECNGKGVIKTGSRSGSDCAACGRRGRVSVERDVECPVCHGKGKL